MNALRTPLKRTLVRRDMTPDQMAMMAQMDAMRDGRSEQLRAFYTRDNLRQMAQVLTFDGQGNHMGIALGGNFQTHDGMTVDSTGAFLIGELERLDPTLNLPLTDVTWMRDIMLREDVTFADEHSSFTQSTFASAGSLGAGNGIRTGKAWAGKDTTQLTGIQLDIGKIPQALRLWGLEVKFTIAELESAAKVGRPIDAQKIEGMQLKHQMDIDEQVYVGDAITGDEGLLNSSRVTNVSNLPNGAASSPLWANKTPDEILKDVNDVLQSAWASSAYAVMPDRIGLPPSSFGLIATRIISSGAGNISIMTYLEQNNIITKSGRGQLRFYPMKWAVGAGSGGTYGTEDGHNRMIAYNNDKRFVRYPMTMLQRTPVQYEGLYHKFVYYCRLGVVEFPYAETIAYRDGLS